MVWYGMVWYGMVWYEIIQINMRISQSGFKAPYKTRDVTSQVSWVPSFYLATVLILSFKGIFLNLSIFQIPLHKNVYVVFWGPTDTGFLIW